MSEDLNERPHDGYPRTFLLVRVEDGTGVSGPGVVAWGVEFPDGCCATRWNSKIAQTCAWESVEDVVAIHGHDGKTRIRWLDD